MDMQSLMHFVPLFILVGFSIISWHALKSENNNDESLMNFSIGWVFIAIMSFVFSLLFFVAGAVVLPIIQLLVSGAAAFMANKFNKMGRIE